MSTYSNWREDLIEVIDTPTTEDKAEKKIKESKVKNKVVINPTFKEAVAEMGGQILEVAEVDDKKGTEEDPQIKSKQKRQGMLKRQVLLKKLQAVRSGGGADITAGYEPEGEMVDESRLVKKLTRPIRKAKRIGKRVLDTFDSDPGRAHTIGSLGNPSVKNDDKRAAERKAGKKKVAEGYAKPNKELPKGSKVHVKKGVKVQGKYVKEGIKGEDNETRKAAALERKAGKKTRLSPSAGKANVAKMLWDIRNAKSNPQNESAVLDANTKIQKKDERKKKEKEYARLVSILAHQKDLKKRGLGEEALDERLGGKGYSKQAAASSVYPGKKGTGDWEDSDRGAGNKAARRAGKKVVKKSPTYRAHVLNKEGYEEKKTGEVLAAFKRDPKVRKRFEKAAKKEDGPGSVKNRAADSMLQTAKDTAKRKGDTSKSDDRYAYEEVVLEKDLNAAERRALPNKDFVFPGKGEGPEGKQRGAYPINDKKHARAALAMAAAHASPEKEAKVKAAVKKKYPDIEVSEGVMKFVKSIGRKKSVKKATMDATTDKLHDWRQKNSKEQQEREKYVSPFRPIVKEADDKAYKYVVSKLKKQYGDGVLTKGDKIKPLTPEQKKAKAAHDAKIAKERAVEFKKDPSQGRYPPGYSNRGSD